MDRGVIQVYYGEGHGKSTRGNRECNSYCQRGEKASFIIQFLKGKNENELTF